MIKGNKICALAVSSPARQPDRPNVPTFAEAGYPGFEVEGWYALYAPAKTPPAIIARLSADLAKIMQMREVDSKLKALAVKPSYGFPEQLGAFTQANFANYGKVSKTSNIKAD